MPAIQFEGRTLDVRPDRLDIRDYPYRPRLQSLPHQYPGKAFIDASFDAYAQLVLDQGKEGACTGFGLAAMIHYLLWRKSIEQAEAADSAGSIAGVKRVSTRMLYHLARIYDEWDGEDYTGSSCRGAMKGWHHHGVCEETLWPYRDDSERERFLPPRAGWEHDATSRPIGAYYRIDRKSLTDLQSALWEVGAIYVSCYVHDGWQLGKLDAKNGLPAIKPSEDRIGAHAFAVVGYTEDGFILQNSWGSGWGYNGFALLDYGDWMRNGIDAWVATLGVPRGVDRSPVSRVSAELGFMEGARAQAGLRQDDDFEAIARKYKNDRVKPWPEDRAYEHTVVVGNNGRPVLRRLGSANPTAEVEDKALELPKAWLQAEGATRVCLYFHGGLNSEGAAIRRVRVMAPYFAANGIYPIFVAWRTGLLETMGGIFGDLVFGEPEDVLAEGVRERIRRALQEAKDRTIEIGVRPLGRPIWSEMKENAAFGARSSGALTLLAKSLAKLSAQVPGLEIHAIGHSAGAIAVGHLLSPLAKERLKLQTCTLFAPACSVEFALRHYVKGGKLAPALGGNKIRCEILDDEAERDDRVQVYGKSLLYLVSRAFESDHKTPILGMEAAWHSTVQQEDQWSEDGEKDVVRWRKLAGSAGILEVHPLRSSKARTNGQEPIQPTHGFFDNDIGILTSALQRIRRTNLNAPVEFLLF